MGRSCRSAVKILTGKPSGKRPLGRPRRRWEYNIRMNLSLKTVETGGIKINKNLDN